MVRAVRVWHHKCHPAPISHHYPIEEITGTYGDAVKKMLSGGSLILIEHDVDPLAAQLERVRCYSEESPSTVFAARYLLHPITTGLDHPVCAHRPRMGEWLEEEGIVPIQYFGLGCTYLPKEVGDLIEPRWDYPALDYLISQAWHEAGGRAYATPDWVAHHHG